MGGLLGSPVEVEKHAGMQGGHELGLQNGRPHMKQEAVFNTTCMQALLQQRTRGTVLLPWSCKSD